MKTGIFVWEFGHEGQDYSGPVSVDDAALPLAAVFVKALDGATFMGAIDDSPVAIESPAGAQRVAQAYAARGIRMVPWGVVQCPSITQAQLEGARAGAVAASVLGTYIVDLEDGPGFFAGDDETVGAFVESFQQAGGRELWICADTRAAHIAPTHLGRWMGSAIVTRLMPMIYWPAFVQAPGFAITDCLAPLSAMNPATIVPVFPADADPQELVSAINMARASHLGGFTLWRRGTLTQGTVDILQSLPDWDGASGPVEVIPILVSPPSPPPPTEPVMMRDVEPLTAGDLRVVQAQAYSQGWIDAIKRVQAMAAAVPAAPDVNPYDLTEAQIVAGAQA